MNWDKKGHVFSPAADLWWARTNATFPTVDRLTDGRLRIYYTGLDEKQVGRTGYVEVLETDPTQVVFETREPVLDVGVPGSFDDCGANAFTIVNAGDLKYMYYQGWQLTKRAPYSIFTGLAISEDGGKTFRKHSTLPVLDRVPGDEFMRAAPFVLVDEGKFRMWYVSCLKWVEDEHGMRYQVVIRHAESADGIRWTHSDRACVVPNFPDEYAIGRPVVTLNNGTYRMWYSIRSLSRPYRLGYAESIDGLSWVRRDEVMDIERSTVGWDSEMLCYGYVVTHSKRTLMFYNGNRHGATGFGLATSDDPLPAALKTSATTRE